MQKYVTKWCPHCKYKYQNFQSSHLRDCGSPFRICGNCGKGFVDKDFVEVGLTERFKPARVSATSIIWFIGGLLFPLLWDAAGMSFDFFGLLFSLIPLVFGIILVVSDLLSYSKRRAYYEEELRKSNARLSSPEYIMALVKIGYDVPYQTRLKAKKDLEDRNN